MTSALLMKLPPNQWTNVIFDETALIKGKLISYIGKAIIGKPVTYDLEIHPHGMVTGDSNSGKTEAIRNHIHSMQLSGLNPQINIIDPKNDLFDVKCDFITTNIARAIARLEVLVSLGWARQAKYTKHGCKNYFDYQRKVDPNEQPIIICFDEITDALTKDPAEVLEKDEIPKERLTLWLIKVYC